MPARIIEEYAPGLQETACDRLSTFKEQTLNFSVQAWQVAAQQVADTKVTIADSLANPMTVLTKTSSLGLSLQPSPVVNQVRNASLLYMHKHGPHQKTCTKRKPLDGQPFMKGVVLKTLIKKPKKPNSANRKCVLVRLTNGKELVAYVPGEGHNLQEHNIVLTRVGRLQDVPGVKIKCVRGKYDLQHVIKKK
nr:EOG090X0NTZ [Triops cancriformis]